MRASLPLIHKKVGTKVFAPHVPTNQSEARLSQEWAMVTSPWEGLVPSFVYRARLDGPLPTGMRSTGKERGRPCKRPWALLQCGQSGSVKTRSAVVLSWALSLSFASRTPGTRAKSSSTRPVSVGLYVDGQFADAYRSDGIIVATPTGSTAYSLSAGGPVLAPDLKAFVINSVCPHTLHSRPMVVGADAVIELRIMGGGEAQLVVDGTAAADLGAETRITVGRADTEAPFVDIGKNNFYERLLDKMNGWGSAQSAEVRF